MPSFKIIGLLVLEKEVLKGYTIYGHGGHLGHVTCTIYIYFFPLPKKAPHEIRQRRRCLKIIRNAPFYILLFLPHGWVDDIILVILYVRVQ